MAIRAHYISFALDEEGRPIPGATVTVRQQGTETNITETIYALDDTDPTTKTNPFTANADGKIEFFLDAAKRVDVFVTKTGYTSQTITADVGKLDPTIFSLLDGGAGMAVRSGINFRDAFVLSDDPGNNRTNVDLEYAGTAEVTDVAATEDAGADVKVARGGHRHAHGSGYLPNAHHTQVHAIDGPDHTGTLPSHAEDHDHDGAPTQQLLAANTHQSPSPNTHHNKVHGNEDHSAPSPSVITRDTTSVITGAATSEVTLKLVAIPGDLFGKSLRITAAFTASGTSGNKRIRFKYGSVTFFDPVFSSVAEEIVLTSTLVPISSSSVKAISQMVGPTLQQVDYRQFSPGDVTNENLEITAQTDISGDELVIEMLVVELV